MITNQLDNAYEAQIAANVLIVQENIYKSAEQSGRTADQIHLMAVTKTVPPAYVNTAIRQGIALLGENRAQELLEKYDAYELDCCDVHFIGHLQRNKVKSIINKVTMIESLDSIRLAQEVDQQAMEQGKTMDVLIQVNIGEQPSKTGFLEQEIFEVLHRLSSFRNIKIKGLMAIPPQAQSKYYFEKMQKLFIDITAKAIHNIRMEYLSMGMSSDYQKAILCGANIVRVGSAIFGNRKI